MAIFPSTFKTMLCAVCLVPLAALPQEWEIDWDEVDAAVGEVNRWANDNLEESVLRQFGEVDRAQIRGFLSQAQTEFQSRYVLDLALLKDSALLVLPLLEQYEEALPYAAWLKPRLDYLEVSQQLRQELLPAGKRVSEVPPPSAQQQKEAWTRKLAERPWPANAKTYVQQLKPVFAAEKIPAELVWVAEVESSFNPRALSPAGAAGLFQLMPATARRFGLATSPQDERLLPAPSAQAAARYLRFLHGKFKDWRLAMAAYNCGEGTVQRALSTRKTRSFEEIAGNLPAETQLYVPKVEATLLRREGLKLGDL